MIRKEVLFMPGMTLSQLFLNYLVQGCVLVFSIFVMVVNLLVDLAYKWIDPRVELD